MIIIEQKYNMEKQDLSSEEKKLLDVIEIKVYDISQNIEILGKRLSNNQIKDSVAQNFSIFCQLKYIFQKLNISPIYEIMKKMQTSSILVSEVLIERIEHSSQQVTPRPQTTVPKIVQLVNTPEIIDRIVKSPKLGGVNLYNESYRRGLDYFQVQSEVRQQQFTGKCPLRPSKKYKQKMLSACIEDRDFEEKDGLIDEISNFIEQYKGNSKIKGYVSYQKELEEIIQFFKSSQKQAMNFLNKSPNNTQYTEDYINRLNDLEMDIKLKQNKEKLTIQQKIKFFIEKLKQKIVQAQKKYQDKHQKLVQFQKSLKKQTMSVTTQTNDLTDKKIRELQSKCRQQQEKYNILVSLRKDQFSNEDKLYELEHQINIRENQNKKLKNTISQMEEDIQFFKKIIRDNKEKLGGTEFENKKRTRIMKQQKSRKEIEEPSQPNEVADLEKLYFQKKNKRNDQRGAFVQRSSSGSFRRKESQREGSDQQMNEQPDEHLENSLGKGSERVTKTDKDGDSKITDKSKKEVTTNVRKQDKSDTQFVESPLGSDLKRQNRRQYTMMDSNRQDKTKVRNQKNKLTMSSLHKSDIQDIYSSNHTEESEKNQGVDDIVLQTPVKQTRESSFKAQFKKSNISKNLQKSQEIDKNQVKIDEYAQNIEGPTSLEKPSQVNQKKSKQANINAFRKDKKVTMYKQTSVYKEKNPSQKPNNQKPAVEKLDQSNKSIMKNTTDQKSSKSIRSILASSKMINNVDSKSIQQPSSKKSNKVINQSQIQKQISLENAREIEKEPDKQIFRQSKSTSILAQVSIFKNNKQKIQPSIQQTNQNTSLPRELQNIPEKKEDLIKEVKQKPQIRMKSISRDHFIQEKIQQKQQDNYFQIFQQYSIKINCNVNYVKPYLYNEEGIVENNSYNFGNKIQKQYVRSSTFKQNKSKPKGKQMHEMLRRSKNQDPLQAQDNDIHYGQVLYQPKKPKLKAHARQSHTIDKFKQNLFIQNSIKRSLEKKQPDLKKSTEKQSKNSNNSNQPISSTQAIKQNQYESKKTYKELNPKFSKTQNFLPFKKSSNQHSIGIKQLVLLLQKNNDNIPSKNASQKNPAQRLSKNKVGLHLSKSHAINSSKQNAIYEDYSISSESKNIVSYIMKQLDKENLNFSEFTEIVGLIKAAQPQHLHKENTSQQFEVTSTRYQPQRKSNVENSAKNNTNHSFYNKPMPDEQKHNEKFFGLTICSIEKIKQVHQRQSKCQTQPGKMCQHLLKYMEIIKKVSDGAGRQSIKLPVQRIGEEGFNKKMSKTEASNYLLQHINSDDQEDRSKRALPVITSTSQGYYKPKSKGNQFIKR